MTSPLRLAALVLLGTGASAQIPTFKTPGMPKGLHHSHGGATLPSGLASHFGLVLDTFADQVFTDIPDEDGFGIELRTFELSASADLSRTLSGYAVVVFEGDEDDEFELEEAAVTYRGIHDNWSIRAGRYFVDFGKTMQIHRHDLRTLRRPFALRTFLGNELNGDGIQFDHWFASGERAAVRYSLAAFGSLKAERDEDEGNLLFEEIDEDRREIDDLAITARITGFADVSSTSQLQVGVSYRLIPDFQFDFEPSAAVVDGLSNGVLGIDATFAWSDLTQTKRWTLGAEFLWNNGDVGATIGDGGTPGDFTDDSLTVLKDDVIGFFVFGDYGWDRYNSIGAQYSWAQLPEAMTPEAGEIDLYYSRYFAEHHRLRFGVTVAHSDVEDDSVRLTVQYTGSVGAHADGASW